MLSTVRAYSPQSYTARMVAPAITRHQGWSATSGRSELVKSDERADFAAEVEKVEVRKSRPVVNTANPITMEMAAGQWWSHPSYRKVMGN